MKLRITIFALLTFQVCYSQELDIFQNDSVYAKNIISKRTMYSKNGNKLQKELVTFYNSLGQKTKQFWYWNGDNEFHNVETFKYSAENLLFLLIDSMRKGDIETTNYFYEDKYLKKQVTLNQNFDTCDFRSYPTKNITIKRWYINGAAYRYDTTVFEKANVKLEYYGTEYPPKPSTFSKVLRPDSVNVLQSIKPSRWNYKFINQFDSKGNLIKVSAQVENSFSSFTRYNYDKRNLLIKKQEVFILNGQEVISAEYTFVYD